MYFFKLKAGSMFSPKYSQYMCCVLLSALHMIKNKQMTLLWYLTGFKWFTLSLTFINIEIFEPWQRINSTLTYEYVLWGFIVNLQGRRNSHKLIRQGIFLTFNWLLGTEYFWLMMIMVMVILILFETHPRCWKLLFIITSAMAKVMFSSLSIALSVCLSVCLIAILPKNCWTDFHEIFRVGLDTRNNWEHFQDVPFNPLNTGCFSHFLGAIHVSRQHCRKMVERIFMKFSKEDRHDTGSNLEYIQNVTVNPLNPGSIYLFPGSVFVCNTME